MARVALGIATLISAFIIALALIRGVGAKTQNPLTPMFSEISLSDGQKEVCWRGICPKKSTLNQATVTLNTLLTFDPRYSEEGNHLCWGIDKELYGVCIFLDKDVVRSLELYFQRGHPIEESITMSLGDLITLWGNPVSMTEPFCGTTNMLFGNDVLVEFPWVLTSKPNGEYSWVLDPVLPEIPYIKIGDSTKDRNLFRIINWRGFSHLDGAMLCGGE